MTALSEYRKAIGAGLVTFGGALVTAALSDGITGSEWYGIIGATLAAVGTVWAVPNSQDAATDDKPISVPQKDNTGTVVSTVVVPGPSASTFTSGSAGSTVTVTNPFSTGGSAAGPSATIREPEGD